MWKKALKIVKHFEVHPKLECMIIQCTSENGLPYLVYHCLVGSYKPDPFLARLAREVGKRESLLVPNPVVGVRIFGESGIYRFTTINEYTVNTFYAYLGWDTDDSGTVMDAINARAKEPYRRLSADIKRTAIDFLKLAESYSFDQRVLEFVINLKTNYKSK